jgi:hypothetical protein
MTTMKRLSVLLLVALAGVALARASSPPSAALSWTAPTQNIDGTTITGTITYNIYQGLAGALVKVQSGVTGTAATITTGLTAGTTQCFAITAVVSASESAQSTAACAAIPVPTPNAPSQVIVVITGN